MPTEIYNNNNWTVEKNKNELSRQYRFNTKSEFFLVPLQIIIDV